MGLRIGIDCDGVLRDLIPAIQESVKKTHPQHVDKMKNIMMNPIVWIMMFWII